MEEIQRGAGPESSRRIAVLQNDDAGLPSDWIDGRRYRIPPNGWKSWYRTVDLRFTKMVGLRGRMRLSIIAEAFNLFNTENYAGYFGVQRSDTGEPRPDFGTPSEIFATRQFQLGSRFEF